jgi:phosphoribosylanthranilate isomerase
MTRVKICGVTSVADARLAVEAGADAIGLNFYPESPRCLSLDTAAAISAAVPPGVCRVGVFVDAARAEVARVVEQLALDAVQFHGDEDAEQCRGWTCTTIKAVPIRDINSLASAAALAVDLVLADAYFAGPRGGTRQPVAPQWLVGFPPERLILAGGLTPENVIAAIRAVWPAMVDVASGVERAPGVKDPEKVERFIANVRLA